MEERREKRRLRQERAAAAGEEDRERRRRRRHPAGPRGDEQDENGGGGGGGARAWGVNRSRGVRSPDVARGIRIFLSRSRRHRASSPNSGSERRFRWSSSDSSTDTDWTPRRPNLRYVFTACTYTYLYNFLMSSITFFSPIPAVRPSPRRAYPPITQIPNSLETTGGPGAGHSSYPHPTTRPRPTTTTQARRTAADPLATATAAATTAETPAAAMGPATAAARTKKERTPG